MLNNDQYGLEWLEYMKILVVQTNTYRFLSPTPLGASMVAGRLRRDGHEVRFVDLMHAREPVQAVAAEASSFCPDLACFSIRNRDNMDPSDYFDPIPLIAEIIAAVRKVSRRAGALGRNGIHHLPSPRAAGDGKRMGNSRRRSGCGSPVRPVSREWSTGSCRARSRVPR